MKKYKIRNLLCIFSVVLSVVGIIFTYLYINEDNNYRSALDVYTKEYWAKERKADEDIKKYENEYWSAKNTEDRQRYKRLVELSEGKKRIYASGGMAYYNSVLRPMTEKIDAYCYTMICLYSLSGVAVISTVVVAKKFKDEINKERSSNDNY